MRWGRSDGGARVLVGGRPVALRARRGGDADWVALRAQLLRRVARALGKEVARDG